MVHSADPVIGSTKWREMKTEGGWLDANALADANTTRRNEVNEKKEREKERERLLLH